MTALRRSCFVRSLLAGLLLSLGLPAYAGSCAVATTYATPTYAPVVKTNAALITAFLPVIPAVATPLFVSTYDPSYAAVVPAVAVPTAVPVAAPAVAQPAGIFRGGRPACEDVAAQLAAKFDRVIDRLDAMQRDLDGVKEAVRTRPGNGNAPPAPQPAPPEPAPQPDPRPKLPDAPPPPAPQSAAPGGKVFPASAKVAQLLQAKCASCHSDEAGKGGGYALFVKGKLRQLTLEDWNACSAKVYGNEMPPKGGLSDAEVGIIMADALQAAKANKLAAK